MGTNPTFKPSFFKILIDFTVDLGLPKEFTKKYRALVLPKNGKAKLRIASGATWEVTLEKLEDNRYYFTNGWTDFSREMDLKRYELLEFAYVGNDIFHVTVYATSAFEKESNFNVVVTNPDSDSGSSSGSGSGSTSSDNSSSNPRFKLLMSNRSLYQVHVKKDFVRSVGLIEGERMRLECPGGPSAEVVVHCTVTNTGVRVFSFSAGWARFRRANGLTVGETYTFELVPSPSPTPTNIKVVRIMPAYV